MVKNLFFSSFFFFFFAENRLAAERVNFVAVTVMLLYINEKAVFTAAVLKLATV